MPVKDSKGLPKGSHGGSGPLTLKEFQVSMVLVFCMVSMLSMSSMVSVVSMLSMVSLASVANNSELGHCAKGSSAFRVELLAATDPCNMPQGYAAGQGWGMRYENSDTNMCT